MRFWRKEQIKESDMLAGCINGERKMQEYFYNSYSSKMYSICLRYASDSAEAEDMLQEGFIKAFNNLGKFRNEGSFEGWLKRIFVNVAIEFFRKKQRRNVFQDEEELKFELIQEDAFHNLAAADLLKMIQMLSPGYRTVFNLYAIEGYSHQEIAAMLKINEGTSKSQLSRARFLLQKMVTNSNKVKKYAAIL